METISIIIPAYNVGATIERCIQSILKQTFQDFKIYVVDDCSTDNTWSVLEDLALTDNRIRISRNNQNSGPSVSRNNALEICEGKWICFIDSDDYICERFLEKLIGSSDNADIVIGSFVSIDNNGNILKNYKVDESYTATTIAQALQKAYGGRDDLDFIYNLCWNKLYKHTLFINNTKFPKGRLQEDAYIMAYLIYNSRGHIAIAPDALYYYVDHSQSISHSSQNGIADFYRREDLIYLYENHIKLHKSHNNLLYKRSRANLLNNIVTIYRLYYNTYSKQYEQEFKLLAKSFKHHFLRSLFENNRNLSVPLLLTWTLFIISPKYYLKLF